MNAIEPFQVQVRLQKLVDVVVGKSDVVVSAGDGGQGIEGRQWDGRGCVEDRLDTRIGRDTRERRLRCGDIRTWWRDLSGLEWRFERLGVLVNLRGRISKSVQVLVLWGRFSHGNCMMMMKELEPWVESKGESQLIDVDMYCFLCSAVQPCGIIYVWVPGARPRAQRTAVSTHLLEAVTASRPRICLSCGGSGRANYPRGVCAAHCQVGTWWGLDCLSSAWPHPVAHAP